MIDVKDLLTDEVIALAIPDAVNALDEGLRSSQKRSIKIGMFKALKDAETHNPRDMVITAMSLKLSIERSEVSSARSLRLATSLGYLAVALLLAAGYRVRYSAGTLNYVRENVKD